MDERLEITINKIGQQIRNANDLSCKNINEVGKTILDWQNEFTDSDVGTFNFLSEEEIFDDAIELDNKIIFTLQDGSKWRYVRAEYKCILHHFNNMFDEGTNIFQCLDEENLFKCGDCNTFLRQRDNIVKNYYFNDSTGVLFPIGWKDNKIIAWCKKREKQEDKYTEESYRNYLGRRQDYLNSIDKDCDTCIHMKYGECEYSYPEYDNETGECEDWEMGE